MRNSAIGLITLLAVLAPLSAAVGQSTLDHPVGQDVPYVLDSGLFDGDASDVALAFSETVHVPNAAWLRLHFGKSHLAKGSIVRMTSQLDGEVQELDADGLAMWSFGSAYFNGDSIDVELITAPGTVDNRVVIEEVTVEFLTDAGTRGASGQCGICGGVDDRLPSAQDYSCRLMNVGCTASVWTSRSCLVSAGHCISGTLVAQFRVPNSTAGCATVNPPVADQFPIISTQQINGGVGNDWSVLTTGTNGAANGNQKPFQRYGKLRRITPVAAANASAVEMFGFGLDLTCTRSQTQQRSVGTITAVAASSYQYDADVRGGNSGSGLLKDGRIIAIVTHCSTGCPNYGTRVDLGSFVTARNQLCPACVADVDGNGAVDLNDLAFLLGKFGNCYPSALFAPEADLNADNCVDLADLAILLAAFGQICP